jgi:hypothetical protein
MCHSPDITAVRAVRHDLALEAARVAQRHATSRGVGTLFGTHRRTRTCGAR